MARIGLSSGYETIPEGTYIFKVTGVNYKEAYGKIEVSMQTQDGSKHTERFSLLRKDGTPNDSALNAFSFFAKTVLNNFDVTEIDEQDLVGHYIECDVSHEQVESTKHPGTMNTYARLGDKRPSDGWGDTPVEETPAKPTMDLASLLG